MLKKILILISIFSLLFAVSLWTAPAARALQSPQTPFVGVIPQFVQPLPILSVASPTTVPPAPANNTITTVFGNTTLTIRMCEFDAQVLPPPNVRTRVWGYIVDTGTGCPTTPQDTYTGPVILNSRGTPTPITFINDLGDTSTSQLTFWKYSVDQTLNWADPLNNEANNCAMKAELGLFPGGLTYPPPGDPCAQNYTGPIPAVVHIHGGEVPPELDGGPDAWFMSKGVCVDGAGIADTPPTICTTNANCTALKPNCSVVKGHAYYTFNPAVDPPNAAVYKYPNRMEAAPIWFHDHLLGGTRLNVHAGLAGAYIISDPTLVLPTGLHPYGLSYAAAGQTPTLDVPTIPMVIQDRMFDTAGQLFFPADSAGLYSPNPEHPYWVPEFFGDTILVNGKVWPFLDVQAKRYRFLFINGSNARTYLMDLAGGPPFWVIGTDGGYLDAPVKVNRLLIMPGERYEVIIDFAGFAGRTGRNIILSNSGRAPYPAGIAPTGGLRQIMQFRVKPFAGADNSYNPALGIPLRTGSQMIVRLPGTPNGPAMVTAPTVPGGPTQNVQTTRQLTLNEVLMGPRNVIDPVTGAMAAYLGGPVEILVNNTKYEGKFQGIARYDFTPISVGNKITYYSELPQEGDTEVWEIVNLTVDAHPIHLHLVQFQLINRQNINVNGYTRAYNAAFPAIPGDPICTGGVYCPGYGPPLPYNPPFGVEKYGGNPDIKPFLAGKPALPLPEEAGWKDTVVMYPGQVTRIAVRWAPTDKPNTALPADLFFPFDVSGGLTLANGQWINGHGYVWHCHIVDHEDNEMMRPNTVTLNPAAPLPAARLLKKGADY